MGSKVGARKVWSNWAGSQKCIPAEVAQPRSEEELVAVVRRAAEAGLRVKPVGAGHSFTAIACTDGIQVDLRRYAAVVDHDPEACTVTVQAGISLQTLCEELDRRGLALPNMGDIAYQSIAGATATATHGTGLAFQNLSAQIVALRLVTGDGTVVAADAHHAPEVLDVARVGLGALGIASTVTIRCVPAFRLRAVEAPMPVDEVLADFLGFMAQSDHVEFYWVPHTRWALTKVNTRTDDEPRPRSRPKALLDDWVGPNLLFGTMNRIGRRFPAQVPRLSKIIPSASSTSSYTDRSDKVFTSPRLVRFNEMEYAIDLEAVPEALQRVRALVEHLGLPISFPVEVRAVAGDDIPLSTAYGRPTGYIAVHTYRGTPYDQYFQGVEQIMVGYGGRPHWGKMHFRSHRSLADAYPRWDEFQAMRARLDPDGRFANPYLDKVLGPVGG